MVCVNIQIRGVKLEEFVSGNGTLKRYAFAGIDDSGDKWKVFVRQDEPSGIVDHLLNTTGFILRFSLDGFSQRNGLRVGGGRVVETVTERQAYFKSSAKPPVTTA